MFVPVSTVVMRQPSRSAVHRQTDGKKGRQQTDRQTDRQTEWLL